MSSYVVDDLTLEILATLTELDRARKQLLLDDLRRLITEQRAEKLAKA
jgi:hypothetical protein